MGSGKCPEILHEGGDHFSDANDGVESRVKLILVDVPQIKSEMKLRSNFSAGSARDVEKGQELVSRASFEAFGNV